MRVTSELTRQAPTARLRADATLEFQRSNCLPVRSRKADCRRCVETCPLDLLRHDEQGLRLDEGCLACGRCTAVCPTGALRVPGFAARPVPELSALTVDCWRVPLRRERAGALRVPCLGGLTPGHLLEICSDANGKPVHLLDRGWCRHCPTGGSQHPAATTLGTVRELLTALGIPAAQQPRLRSEPLPPKAMATQPGQFQAEMSLSRRGFFRSLAAHAVHTAGAQEEPEPPLPTLRETQLPIERYRLLVALHRLAPGVPLPASLFPALSVSAACNSHGICAAICPTGALRQYRRGGCRGIEFDAAACVACGECASVCPEGALHLGSCGAGTVAPGAQPLTAFTEQRCRDCSAAFTGDNNDQCPACRRDNTLGGDLFGALFGHT